MSYELLGVKTYGDTSVRLSQFRPTDKPYPMCRWLSHIWTAEEHRGKGSASRMLKNVMRQADDAHLTLILQPSNEDFAGLDIVQLESWYTRHGFVRIQDSPLIMARTPKP